MSSRKNAPEAPETPDLVAEGGPEPEGGRLDRAEHRAQMLDLKALATRLAKLPQGVRRTLPLDEELQQELDRYAAAGPMPHRRRLLMRVKLLLGSADLERLQAVLGGDTDEAALERSVQRWRKDILAGDDAVLQRFVDAHPAVDRQGLRTASREARKQGAVAARASTRLTQLLRAALSAPKAPTTPEAEETS